MAGHSALPASVSSSWEVGVNLVVPTGIPGGMREPLAFRLWQLLLLFLEAGWLGEGNENGLSELHFQLSSSSQAGSPTQAS